jgi:hypothetical protein
MSSTAGRVVLALAALTFLNVDDPTRRVDVADLGGRHLKPGAGLADLDHRRTLLESALREADHAFDGLG